MQLGIGLEFGFRVRELCVLVLFGCVCVFGREDVFEFPIMILSEPLIFMRGAGFRPLG